MRADLLEKLLTKTFLSKQVEVSLRPAMAVAEDFNKEKLGEILRAIFEIYRRKFEEKLKEIEDPDLRRIFESNKKFEDLSEDELKRINTLSIETAEILSFLVRFYGIASSGYKNLLPENFNEKEFKNNIKKASEFLHKAVELVVDPGSPHGFSYLAYALAGEQFPYSLVPIGNCSVLEGIFETDLFLGEDITNDEALKKLVGLLLNSKLRKEGFYDNAYFFHIGLEGYEGAMFHDLWTTSTVATLLKVLYSKIKEKKPDDPLVRDIGEVLNEIVKGTCEILRDIIEKRRSYIHVPVYVRAGSSTENELKRYFERHGVARGALAMHDTLLNNAKNLIRGREPYTHLFAIARILRLGLDDKTGKPEDFIHDKDTYNNMAKAWLRITLNGIKQVIKQGIKDREIIVGEDGILCLTYSSEERKLTLGVRSVDPLPFMTKVLIELYESPRSEIIEVAMDPFLNIFYPCMGISIRELISVYDKRRKKYEIFGVTREGNDDFGATNLISFLLVEYYKSFNAIENSFFGKPYEFLDKMERKLEKITVRIEPAATGEVYARLIKTDEVLSITKNVVNFEITEYKEVLKEIGGETIEGIRRGIYKEGIIRKGTEESTEDEKKVKEKLYDTIEDKIKDEDLFAPVEKELLDSIPVILEVVAEEDQEIPWELLMGERPVGRIPLTSDIECKEIREDYIIRILLIGNPEGDLEEATKEIDEIYNELKSLSSEGYIIYIEKMTDEVYTSQLEDLLERESWDILHFAGHATKKGAKILWRLKNSYFDPLSIEEKYAPTFVFANACATAASNKDILSLPIELLKKGVIAVIGTLWPVHDDSAIEFARAFYRNLLGGRGTSIGEAFHIARKILRERKDPNWANYVLYGDPRFRLIWGK
jgi:hypothetical protein